MNTVSVKESVKLAQLHLTESQVRSISDELDSAGVDFMDLSEEEVMSIAQRYVVHKN